MRIRALKPGFFKNEQLAELSPWHRLCFEGLWCCADREGRLQDRPKRLKAEIFPYDELDMDMLMWDLARAGFIRRYQVGAHPFVWVPTWNEHQHPRADEAASTYPAYAEGMDRVGGPHGMTFPAVRTVDTLVTAKQQEREQLLAIDTDPSLHSDAAATPARMGNGILEVGSGTLDLGNGERAAASALHPSRAQDLIDLWNATTKPPLPRCRELTDERRRKIRARLASRPSLTDWRRVFEAVQGSAFCRGQNDRGWIADFDYVIKNDTVSAKLLERAGTSETASYEWTCPHEPKCSARHACHVKTELEAARKSRAS